MATTFTNERKMASVQNVANDITLTGECQHNATNNRIVNFNGSVSNGTLAGNFYYAEQEGGNINYNISAPSSLRQSVESLMFSTVTDIHTEYDVTTEEE